MFSYVVTGAARDLGYEFLSQLGNDPSNVVIGFVRNKAATDAKDRLPKNVHIIEADITSLAAQQAAAQQVAILTDELTVVAFDTLNEIFVKDLREMFKTNVIDVMNTISAFMPLILKSKTKKVITLSNGFADVEVTKKKISTSPAQFPYSISKAASDMLVSKCHAEYQEQGVLFLAISPGIVDTGNIKSQDPNAPPNPMMARLLSYVPHYKGPITLEASVRMVME